MKNRLAWLGCFLAALTLMAGIGLLSLSGWFISATAFAGLTTATALSFNYFLPSAGVRFFSLLRIVSRYLERVVTHEVTFKTLSNLRVALYSALEPLAPAHLLRYRSGELLNRMVTDVDTLDQLYIRIITPLIAALAIGVVLAFYLHYFSWTLTLLICGMFSLSLILLPLLLAGLGKATGIHQLLLQADLRSLLLEGVQGQGELILLEQWPNHVQKIATHSQNLIRSQFKMACLQGLANALLLTLSGMTLVLVVWIAAPLVNQHQLNGANLALLVLVVLAAFEALAPITLGAQYWSKIQLAATRLRDLKHTLPAVNFPPHSATLPTDYSIELDQVSFGYTPGQLVLQEYSLKVPAGEHYHLEGPSGMGKSTIIHLIARCFDPLQGEVRIGGIPLKSLAESDLRRLMSVITQRPHLFNASLRDNLLLAQPQANDTQLTEALEQVQLQAWFAKLDEGLDTWLGEGGIQLSGGQLRRLAIARAVLHDAPIWLLDEPTEGLDAETAQAVWQSLTPLMQGRTVVIVQHQS